MSYHAAASILSTNDDTTTINDRPVEVVVGLPLGEAKRRAFYPGEVPSTRPRDSFWSDRFFELPTFTPPRLDPTGEVGIPHLGLDEILASVLQDRL